MTDKSILFLVEGPTDEDTLALIFSKIVKEHDIQFEVLHTDITADEKTEYFETHIMAKNKDRLVATTQSRNSKRNIK